MAGSEQLVRIDGRRLRVTNLDKVLFPATGTTKGEVIDYYTRIAGVLLPHVSGRPITRKRWPDGVGTEADPAMSFFAKDLEPGAPSWLRRLPIPHSGGPKDYPLAADVPTLVYLAQVASLELHVPQWRFGRDGQRGNPDRIVLDLDPGPGVGLPECAEVARHAKNILDGMGLEAFPVTSGSKGIHVYAHLDGTWTSEQVSTVARELARAIEADHPGLAVSQMAKSERTGRVFIDWSQNNAAKTTIAPYSLRGRARPTVAAPRTWDELDDPALAHLTFDAVLARVAEHGDPLAALDPPSADGPLTAYIAKRTATRTPEPVPEHPTGETPDPDSLPRFVIQEHHASRLHWDLRLEHDGVLVSWAVPRGVPHSHTRNNLAVMTEDHPLSYLDFEGVIPKGQYGAGTMTVWDTGHYELEKWRDDEVIFTARGREGGPLGEVRLALIRTEGDGEKSSWLLHRMKTDAAGRPQAAGAPVERSDHGFLTTAAGPPPDDVPASSPEAATPPAGAPAEPVSAAAAPTAGPPPDDVPLSVVNAPLRRPRVGHAKQEVGDAGGGQGAEAAPGAEALPRAVRGAEALRPMLAVSATAGIARRAAGRWATDADGAAWAELKWDGIRAVGVWDGSSLVLRARSGRDLTATYPDLTDTPLDLGALPAVLDGEIVALDDSGRPSFPLLQNRMNLADPREIAREAPRTPVQWYLYDVLSIDGRDVAALPLSARRELLQSIAGDTAAPVRVPPVFDDVDAALATAERFALEGVVVKDPSSPYRRGERTESWLKVKLTRMQDVVIGGIRPGKGGRGGRIGSLLVGIPDADGLRYAGRVGTGFSDATLTRLEKALLPRRTEANPFVGVPDTDTRDALWVTPDLVGEVEFAEFTPGGILRHARWRGLRPDTSPDEVRREDG